MLSPHHYPTFGSFVEEEITGLDDSRCPCIVVFSVEISCVEDAGFVVDVRFVGHPEQKNARQKTYFKEPGDISSARMKTNRRTLIEN